MASLALCPACGSGTFQVLLADLRETVRCAECRTERFAIPEWIAIAGKRQMNAENRIAEVREAMERQAIANNHER